ncbi:TBC1D12_2 [Blepharisma stoltei]|uniref:Rab-GAP TBC domain-containing protein n=1 Tax=Blepharisma stoltei TaxID=1481888 RepID=A0AAU9K5G7_9CILI|nr:unnamed protein product [Blepharisma stoltei]
MSTEQYITELIAAKIKLAECEDKSISKSRQLKLLSEKLNENSNQLDKARNENQSLLDSVAQLIDEKNSLRVQIEKQSGLTKQFSAEQTDTEEDEYRSPDQFFEIPNDEDTVEVWNRVIENWEELEKSKKLKLLSRKGIPAKLRGEIWSKCIGNSLHITPQLFNILLARARASKQADKEENGSVLIPMDLKRTLSGLQVFQKEQPLHQSLHDLLEGFAAYRPDFGYVQGMAYLGAILILHLGTYRAFECFANMLFKSELIRTFYSFDLNGMQSYYKVFEYYMERKVPGVLSRFEEIGISPDVYLLEWIYTMYSRCFSLEIVSRIWDRYFFEGDAYIFKVGLGILIGLDKELQNGDIDSVVGIINNISSHFDSPQKIFRHVDHLNITIYKINKLRIKLKARNSPLN